MRLFALTALTMLAFAANSILNRLALADGEIAAIPVAALRMASGAAALGLFVALRGGRRPDLAATPRRAAWRRGLRRLGAGSAPADRRAPRRGLARPRRPGCRA